MGRTISYTLYDTEWHINMDLIRQDDVCNIFRPVSDYDPAISLKRQAKHYISQHLHIPVDQLKSQIVNFEDLMLDEMVYMLLKFQFGGYTTEEFDYYVKEFIDLYMKTYMDELYHTGLALGKELDQQRFAERRATIQQNHTD